MKNLHVEVKSRSSELLIICRTDFSAENTSNENQAEYIIASKSNRLRARTKRTVSFVSKEVNFFGFQRIGEESKKSRRVVTLFISF